MGEPTADVKPMTVHLKPGAHAVRVKPRVYLPHKAGGWQRTWSTWWQWTWFSAIIRRYTATVTPKGQYNFRLMLDYRAVKATIE